MKKGFTLIELMITVAIIGILALMALPSYQNYIVRVKLTQAVHETNYIQKELADAYLTGGIESVESYIKDWRDKYNNFTPNPDIIDSIYVHDVVHSNRRDDPKTGSSIDVGYVFRYNIVIDTKKIGLQPLLPEYMQDRQMRIITVAWLVDGRIRHDTPQDDDYHYRDTRQTIEGLSGPYCGQWSDNTGEGLNYSPIPRKYLPFGCKDRGLGIPYDSSAVTRDGAFDDFTVW